MKAKNVKIGKVYECKVGKNTTKVRILGRDDKGGWKALNTKTGKGMVITSPERLVKEIGFVDPTAQPVATGAKTGKKASQEPKAKKEAPQRQPRANSGKMSGLDAAVEVLKTSGAPMNAKDIVETAIAKGLWTTNGQTPANTLHAAICREIAKKADARFKKAERGKFMLV